MDSFVRALRVDHNPDGGSRWHNAGAVRHDRDHFLYAVLLGTLPLLAWRGRWLALLAVIILAEIVLTLSDFVVEISVRKPLGDVSAGERVTHAIMGIVYGAVLANLIPVLGTWWSAPTSLCYLPPPIPEWLRWALLAMAAGVFLSGLRDLYSAWGLPYGSWSWRLLPSGTSKGIP